MNIFVLDTAPEIAASYHCDQHLHKMILESAQMLCSVLKARNPNAMIPYKPTHQNHPCTLWLNKSDNNIAWLLRLGYNLNHIRMLVKNTGEHSSVEVLRFCEAFLLPNKFPQQYSIPDEFVFAGPPTIAINSTLSITEKYKKYYRQKHQQWVLDKGHGMSYKGRPIPEFMSDLIN